jgi:hypothetical protein
VEGGSATGVLITDKSHGSGGDERNARLKISARESFVREWGRNYLELAFPNTPIASSRLGRLSDPIVAQGKTQCGRVRSRTKRPPTEAALLQEYGSNCQYDRQDAKSNYTDTKQQIVSHSPSIAFYFGEYNATD